MITINECKVCGKKLNVEFRDAFVCPECMTLYQTVDENFVEMVSEENNQIISRYISIYNEKI